MHADACRKHLQQLRDEFDDRQKACRKHLQQLRDEFDDRQKLLSWSTIFAEEYEEFVASSQSKKARTADH